MTCGSPPRWLKALLSAATLLMLYLRFKRGKAWARSPSARLMIGAAVLLSFGVFHNLGAFRGGTFVHYGEMFHYYLGSKYFNELGYYDLYNAVIVADTEQDNALAGLPFYTDLHTYQNTLRETALGDAYRIKGLFSEVRWTAFKADVAYFKGLIRVSGGWIEVETAAAEQHGGSEVVEAAVAERALL